MICVRARPVAAHTHQSNRLYRYKHIRTHTIKPHEQNALKYVYFILHHPLSYRFVCATKRNAVLMQRQQNENKSALQKTHIDQKKEKEKNLCVLILVLCVSVIFVT